MLQQIDIAEAQAHLSELVEKAIHGDEIIILKDDKPVVKMSPLAPVITTPKPRRKAGSAKGLVHMADDFDAPFEDYSDEL